MSTDSDVIVTEYRAEFKGELFAPFTGRWRIASGMQYKTVLRHRRRWTVELEYQRGINRRDTTQPARKSDNGVTGHIHPSMLLDADAVVIFVPDSPGARFGHAVLIEQIARDNRCGHCPYLAINQPDLHSHILRNHS